MESKKRPACVIESLRYAKIPRRYERAVPADFNLVPAVGVDGIFITGPTGVGKTHLATVLLKLLVADSFKDLKCKKAYWLTATDFMYEIKATFRGNGASTESKVIAGYAGGGVLLLDDVGADTRSDYMLQAVTALITRRLNNLIPTIVTSNYGLKEIHQLDPRLASRLGGMGHHEMKGDDRRLQKKGE